MDARSKKLSTPFSTDESRSAIRLAKQDAVLVASVRMFNAKGFHNTSLDDVAAGLNITKPTIYHYIGNKEQVLLECVNRGFMLLEDVVHQVQQEEGTALNRLKSYLEKYAEVAMSEFGKCVVRTDAESLTQAGAQSFREGKSKINQDLERMIQQAADEGFISVSNIKITTFTIAGALNWPGIWHNPDGELSPKEAAHEVVNVLLTGLLTRSPH